MGANYQMSRAISGMCVLALALLLASCKGRVDPRYTVGGNVAGLAASGLMLQNNGSGNLAISGNGSFVFPQSMEKGSSYDVKVRNQPSGQSCAVANGTGIVNGNVTDVAVTCGGGAVTIGGTVSGLSGAGLVLRNNGGDDLAISAGGSFTFPTPVSTGTSYLVTVLTQPATPTQTCTVSNGSGTASTNVTNVAVSCVTNAYTVGVSVSGLTGAGLVLQNNSADDLPVAADGAYVFATPVPSGSNYGVTVLVHPSGQGCSVAGGSGGITNANVTGVMVSCMGQPAAPTLSLAFGVKELQFSWNAVGGAVFYRLQEDPDGVSGYTQVGNDIAALTVNHSIPVHRRLNAKYIVQACNAAGCTDSAPQFLGANLTQAIGYVKASNTGLNDQFGFAVAVSRDGNTLAVGARNEDSSTTGIDSTPDDAAPDAGAVYVFSRPAGTWVQQAYVKASNAGAGDQFGASVALSGDGNTLAVGAVSEDGNNAGIDSTPNENASNAGAVYVYVRSAGTWSQQAYVKSLNPGQNDLFGNSVALSGDGDTLAVGAPGENSSTTGINSTPNDLASFAGAAYVFVRSGASWAQQAYVKASNTQASDQFGTAIALAEDGNTLAAGAPGEDSSTPGVNSTPNESALTSGAAYVFTRTGAAWVQQAYVKSSNPGSGDQFGASVALSGDGDTLVAGAPREDSDTTGIDGAPNEAAPDAGAAYVFIRVNDLWSQEAFVKPSNTRFGDQFGMAVALSGDGNGLAVGAPLQDLNGNGIDSTATALENDSGTAYFFTRSAGTWSQKAYIKASNTGAGDRFGMSIALSGDGDTLAVGAQTEDGSGTGVGGTQNDSAADSGAVYLY